MNITIEQIKIAYAEAQLENWLLRKQIEALKAQLAEKKEAGA